MNLRSYETLFIVKPNLATETIDKEIENVSKIIGNNGGELLSTDQWGNRKLAYEIDGHANGFYVLSIFKSDPELPKKLETHLQLNENILRQIVLKLDPEPEKPSEQTSEDRSSETIQTESEITSIAAPSNEENPNGDSETLDRTEETEIVSEEPQSTLESDKSKIENIQETKDGAQL